MMHEPRETLGSLPHFSRSAASRRWVLGRWSEGEDSGRKETDDGRLPRPLNVNPGRVQGICPMNYGLQCGAVGRGIKKKRNAGAGSGKRQSEEERLLRPQNPGILVKGPTQD